MLLYLAIFGLCFFLLGIYLYDNKKVFASFEEIIKKVENHKREIKGKEPKHAEKGEEMIKDLKGKFSTMINEKLLEDKQHKLD